MILLSLVVLSSSFRAQSEPSRRSYPLPLAELEQVLWRWLFNSDFEVSRTTMGASEVLLTASNDKESWRFTLKPHSPLATEVSVKCVPTEQCNRTIEAELFAYLATYVDVALSRKEDDDQNPSIAVSSKSESVVCIDADLENEEIQFSGVIIDPEGFIISTAHDLKGVKDISVTLSDGRVFKGHVLKTDLYRDLALIDIKVKLKRSISLRQGRTLLKEGEKLYSIGCPCKQRGVIHGATLIGPPRRMNTLPLWQATMKTLPGSSGSPVFDLQGNLVALVKGRYRGTDSVAFLTPLATILEFLRGTQP